MGVGTRAAQGAVGRSRGSAWNSLLLQGCGGGRRGGMAASTQITWKRLTLSGAIWLISIGILVNILSGSEHCDAGDPVPRLRVVPQSESAAQGKIEVAAQTTSAPLTVPLAPSSSSWSLVDPCVSIVLPVHNQAGTLAESLDGILAQDLRCWELIMVDDGSKDDTARVMASVAADPRVRLLRNKVAVGLPGALTQGFRHATAKYWTWTSGDNVHEPSFLQRMMDHLVEHTNTDLVYSDYFVMDDSGRPLQDETWRSHNREHGKNDWRITLPALPGLQATKTFTEMGDNFLGPSFMYTETAGRSLGGYVTPMGVEDWDYWLRMILPFTLEHLGDHSAFLYKYRVHQNTLSAKAKDLRIGAAAEELMALQRKRTGTWERGSTWFMTTSVDIRRSLGIEVAARGRLMRQRDFAAAARAALTVKGPSILMTDAQGVFSGATQLNLVDTFETQLSSGGVCTVLAVDIVNEGSIAVQYDVARLLGMHPDRTLIAVLDADKKSDESTRHNTVARLRNLHPRVFDLSRTSRHRAVAAIEAGCSNELHGYSTTLQGDPVPPSLPWSKLAGRTTVAFFTDTFIIGGLENVMFDVARAMHRSNMEVVLVVCGKTGPAFAETPGAFDKVHFLNRESEHLSDDINGVLAGVHMVYAHYATFGLAEAAAAQVPVVQVIHNLYTWWDAADVQAFKETDQYTTAYVAVSAEVARYAELVLGTPAEKLLVLRNGVQLQKSCHPLLATSVSGGDKVTLEAVSASRRAARQQLKLPLNGFVVLVAANWYRNKNQAMVVEALQLVEGARDLVLVLAGDHPNRAFEAEVLAQIDKLHHLDRGIEVRVPGFVDSASIRLLLQAADMQLVLSKVEGNSLSVMEAMCSGVAVASTNVGAALEMAALGTLHLLPPIDLTATLPYQKSVLQLWGGTGQVGRKEQIAGVLNTAIKDMEAMAARDSSDKAEAGAQMAWGRLMRVHGNMKALDEASLYVGYVGLAEWLQGGGKVEGYRQQLVVMNAPPR